METTVSEQEMKVENREQRRLDRAYRSSTFKTIAGLEDSPPEEWEEEYLDEVIENVEAIDRDRWAERGIWLFVVLVLAVGSFLGGWHMKPEPKPEPIEWSCTRTYDDIKVDEINCTGIEF